MNHLTPKRMAELLEAFALDAVQFTGAGRGGPARWACHGCRFRDDWREGRGTLRNPPADLARYNYGRHQQDKMRAAKLIPHAHGCPVAEVLGLETGEGAA